MVQKTSRQARQRNGSGLKIVYPICCGMDVHRDFIVACIASTDLQGVTTYERRRFSTFSGDLKACRDWLIERKCFDACMESTGKYWFPVRNILAEPVVIPPEVEPARRFNIVVTHPKYVKAIKGKKTDKRDAQWIADVFKFDMVRGRFIPPEEIRMLRDLCRFWVKITSVNTSQKNRAQNCLTWSNYKLDAVFSNVFGKSASAIVDYMLEHPDEPDFDPAPFVDGRCKTPIDDIREAVKGNFHPVQAEKLKIIKELMGDLSDVKGKLEAIIFRLAEPYERQIELLLTAPGISNRLTAIRIIAEIGVDMTVFDSAKHLSSWAGLCPQNAESAGKKKTTRIGKAGIFIKPLLVEIALAVGKSTKKHPGFATKYRQIAKRRGGKKAHIAIARKLLVAIYQMFLKDEPFNAELYRKSDKPPKERTFTPEQALAFMRSRGYNIIDEPATHPPLPPDSTLAIAA
jgi:transposase